MKAQKNEQLMLPEEGEFDRIEAIIVALRSRFGDAAISVARNQAALATAESVKQWSAVVSRLVP